MWDAPLATCGRLVTAVVPALLPLQRVPWLWQQWGGEPEAGTRLIWTLWCWQPDQAVLPLMCGAAVGWGRWRGQLGLGSIPYLPGWQHRVRLQEGSVGQGHCPCALLGWTGAPGIWQGPTCCPQGGCDGPLLWAVFWAEPGCNTASPNPNTSLGGPSNTWGPRDAACPSQSLMLHRWGPEL